MKWQQVPVVVLVVYLAIFQVRFLALGQEVAMPGLRDWPRPQMDGVIPLPIEEPDGITRRGFPVTQGVPFPRGILRDVNRVRLLDEDGRESDLQARPLAHWPDGSIKWLLVDFQVDVAAKRTRTCRLEYGPAVQRREPKAKLAVRQEPDRIEVNTGPLRFVVQRQTFGVINEAWLNGQKILDGGDSFVHVRVEPHKRLANGRAVSDQWRFQLDPKDEGLAKGWHKPSFDDSQWLPIRVDNFWEVQGHDGYDGIAWYRTRVQCTKEMSEQANLVLHFGAVDEHAWVYLNGELVGGNWEVPAERAWKTPFDVRVQGKLKVGENVLAVRVHDEKNAGGIWRGVEWSELTEFPATAGRYAASGDKDATLTMET
ncbi:MAG: hypothetical protein FJ279_08520 [Planctomycetes bacterium]|nr:hypothetical protein [Planctomycetota bacterium]